MQVSWIDCGGPESSDGCLILISYRLRVNVSIETSKPIPPSLPPSYLLFFFFVLYYHQHHPLPHPATFLLVHVPPPKWLLRRLIEFSLIEQKSIEWPSKWLNILQSTICLLIGSAFVESFLSVPLSLSLSFFLSFFLCPFRCCCWSHHVPVVSFLVDCDCWLICGLHLQDSSGASTGVHQLISCIFFEWQLMELRLGSLAKCTPLPRAFACC